MFVSAEMGRNASQAPLRKVKMFKNAELSADLTSRRGSGGRRISHVTVVGPHSDPDADKVTPSDPDAEKEELLKKNGLGGKSFSRITAGGPARPRRHPARAGARPPAYPCPEKKTRGLAYIYGDTGVSRPSLFASFSGFAML